MWNELWMQYFNVDIIYILVRAKHMSTFVKEDLWHKEIVLSPFPESVSEPRMDHVALTS